MVQCFQGFSEVNLAGDSDSDEDGDADDLRSDEDEDDELEDKVGLDIVIFAEISGASFIYSRIFFYIKYQKV